MTRPIVMDVIARDKSTATLNKVSGGYDKLNKQVATTNGTMNKMASDVKSKVTGVLAGAFAVGGMISFGKKSVSTFQAVAGESLKLQRVMGGTVKSASEWRGAMQLGGISNDQFMASVRTMSKQIAAAGGGKGSAFDKLGLVVRDAQGHMKSMNDLLPLISDRFKAMAPGAEKNALAIQLFGRNGLAMLPFLNRGAEGMEALKKKANELGIVIGDKQADAYKKNVAAQRTMQAAIQGIQIWVGEHLIPALTEFANFMSQHVVPGIKAIARVIGEVVGVIAGWIDWLNKNRVALFLIAGTVAAFVIPALIKMGIQWGILAVQSLIAAARIAAAWIISMGPIAIVTAAVIGLVVLIIKNWDTIKRVTLAVWDAVVGFLRDHWKLIVAVITGPLGALVIFIISHWNTIKNAIVTAMQAVLDFLKAIPGKILGFFSAALSLLVNAGRNVVTGFWNGLKAVWNTVTGWFKSLGGAVKGYIGDAAQWLFQAGKDVIQGFWNGLKFIWDKVTGFIGGIVGWIKDHKGPISLDKQLLYPAGKALMEGLVTGMMHGFTNVVKFVGGIGKWVADQALSVGGGFIPGGPGSKVSANQIAEQAYAFSLFPGLGWGPDQQQSLISLWNGESGWNPQALNSSSGAFGIPQALPASKMASAGADWQTNPATQIRWGLGYIKDRYGTPSEAWAQWLGRSPHWYAQGAWNIPANQLAFLHRGEMVIPSRPADKFRSGLGGITVAPGAVTVYAAAGMDERAVADQAFARLREWVVDEQRRAAKGGRA